MTARSVAVVAALALVVALPAPAAAYQRPGQTERVSVAGDGAEANSVSWEPSISADGGYVAFDSAASNLVPGDTNQTWDIFVHDVETGMTERVSVASDGTEANGSSQMAAISGDGRYVAFQSHATNLVPGITNAFRDVFVHDRQTGETERVSVASDGTEADHGSGHASISADGRYVAFESLASNLVPDDTNGVQDIFVHDRQTGNTERVSVASDGTQAEPTFRQTAYPSISADGRYVVFMSDASNLVPDDTNSRLDVFVHDRVTEETERVSVASDGTQGNADSHAATISGDGRYVAFYSSASNLVPGDTNGRLDVFVHDRETGVTERVSVSSVGGEGDSSSVAPSISGDGRYVPFYSAASNLVPGDTNGRLDVFVHDRETRVTERVSVASDGTEGQGYSRHPHISASGRHVAFDSVAWNLVPGKGNTIQDVFVRDRGPAVGVGGLAVVAQGDDVAVTGWATLSGQPVSVAVALPGGGASAAGPLGAELTGASVVYRPEEQDLLVRLSVRSLPDLDEQGGVPGVLYGLAFDLGGMGYEVRAVRSVTGSPPGEPRFALYACDQLCTEVAGLSGAIGVTGNEVLVSVPLSVLGVEEGTALTDLRAFTAVGDAAGALVPLDELDLPDGAIPAAQVSLGVAPAGTAESEVAFSTDAALTDGLFSGDMDLSSLAAGDYQVWARACLGDVCGAQSARVER